jgi:hypothetical protein
MKNTVSFDNTHAMEMIAAKTDAMPITRFKMVCLIASKSDVNNSHLEKNTYPETNPTAQNTRRNNALTVIVIKP